MEVPQKQENIRQTPYITSTTVSAPIFRSRDFWWPLATETLSTRLITVCWVLNPREPKPAKKGMLSGGGRESRIRGVTLTSIMSNERGKSTQRARARTWQCQREGHVTTATQTSTLPCLQTCHKCLVSYLYICACSVYIFRAPNAASDPELVRWE